MSSSGFQELCLACRRGFEEGESRVFLPALGLLETMVGVFPEQARGQEGHLAAVFLAAMVRGFARMSAGAGGGGEVRFFGAEFSRAAAIAAACTCCVRARVC